MQEEEFKQKVFMDFKYSEISIKDIRKIKLKLNPKINIPSISGVYYKKLITNIDDRGSLTEIWSDSWKKEPIAKKIAHVYYNTTHEGVIKGWHVHEKTFSQYTCVGGSMQVVLVDARKKSKTFGFVDEFLIGKENPSYIKIPPGVLKAWKSLKGDSVIVNLLTSSDVFDNYKYPFDIILKDVWK